MSLLNSMTHLAVAGREVHLTDSRKKKDSATPSIGPFQPSSRIFEERAKLFSNFFTGWIIKPSSLFPHWYPRTWIWGLEIPPEPLLETYLSKYWQWTTMNHNMENFTLSQDNPVESLCLLRRSGKVAVFIAPSSSSSSSPAGRVSQTAFSCPVSPKQGEPWEGLGRVCIPPVWQIFMMGIWKVEFCTYNPKNNTVRHGYKIYGLVRRKWTL